MKAATKAALCGGLVLIVGLMAVMLRGTSGTTPAAAAEPQETPGCLQIIGEKGKPGGLCPLKHTDVEASVAGFIARVDVTQEFHNPSKEKIEAIYTFPLPNDAAVDRMEMQVGKRTIIGEIRRREEARQIYEAARAAGHVAGLLDQERPNIFTQSVANIMPGERVIIKISYTQLLKYEDGTFEFTFPMVVGPRYIPGQPTGQSGTGWAPDTTQVPDASRITPPVTPKGTRAGHDISLTVHINAGVPIQSVKSSLHEVEVNQPDAVRADVTLRNQNEIPNKDFVLKYGVAGEQVESGVLSYSPDGRGGYFSLIMMPPKKPRASQITPKEMIFVIDSSGSQQGEPIQRSKETMLHCIKNMNPGDTFNMIAFNNGLRKLFEQPQGFNSSTEEKALAFLKECEAGGGTEMLPAVKAALEPVADPGRLRIVVFFTDGYIGNDFQILDAVKKNAGQARVFPFGIGNGVNRYLIDKMAELGRGEAEYVYLNAVGQDVAEKFYNRIRNPILTDITVDWNGLPVVLEDQYPKEMPDLFDAKPLIIKGRFTGAQAGQIIVRAKLGGRPWQVSIPADLSGKNPDNDSLASIWARAKVEDLMDKDLMGAQTGKPDTNVKEEIVNLALEFSLMTQYTSFVAVEKTTVTIGGKPRTVAVPVEMPEGVSYEGVFGDAKADAGGTRFKSSNSSRVANYPMLAAPATEATAPTMAGPGGPAMPGAAAPSPSVGYGGGVAYDMSVSAEDSIGEIKQRQPADKLAKMLRDLIKRYKAGDTKTDYSIPGKLIVKNGRVEVSIWVKAGTTEAQAKLAKLGATNLVWLIKGKVAICSIEIRKLDELSKLEWISRIYPPEYVR